jgi:WD40 repeat protein
VAFSPQSKVVATGGEDTMVRLWNVATQRQIGAPLNGHDGEINAVAFSPDGKTLASGGADGTARLWDVSYLVNTPARLCDSAQRSLSSAEWIQYVPAGPAYGTVCP